MTMKQDTNPTTANNHPTIAAVCGHCGVEERNLLHHVRLRGNFRRLCTSCVLRLHPQCFCPACFGVYDRSPPADAVVCYKCYSSSHPNCVPSPVVGPTSSSRSPSPCSSCLNPNALVLNLKRVENGSKTGCRAIDMNVARLLFAAAKISAMSMSKAEVAAATEAERRAKEAAYTKKRAREALDHVVYLMEKEKKNGDSNKKVGSANSSVVAMPLVVVDTRMENNEVDTSNEVLEALNAVELKEKGRQLQGISVESGVSEAQSNGVVVMEVEVTNKKNLAVNSVTENGTGKTDYMGKTAQGEKVGNGLVPLPGQVQILDKNHAPEDDVGLHP